MSGGLDSVRRHIQQAFLRARQTNVPQISVGALVDVLPENKRGRVVALAPSELFIDFGGHLVAVALADVARRVRTVALDLGRLDKAPAALQSAAADVLADCVRSTQPARRSAIHKTWIIAVPKEDAATLIAQALRRIK